MADGGGRRADARRRMADAIVKGKGGGTAAGAAGFEFCLLAIGRF